MSAWVFGAALPSAAQSQDPAPPDLSAAMDSAINDVLLNRPASLVEGAGAVASFQTVDPDYRVNVFRSFINKICVHEGDCSRPPVDVIVDLLSSLPSHHDRCVSLDREVCDKVVPAPPQECVFNRSPKTLGKGVFSQIDRGEGPVTCPPPDMEGCHNEPEEACVGEFSKREALDGVPDRIWKLMSFEDYKGISGASSADLNPDEKDALLAKWTGARRLDARELALVQEEFGALSEAGGFHEDLEKAFEAILRAAPPDSLNADGIGRLLGRLSSECGEWTTYREIVTLPAIQGRPPAREPFAVDRCAGENKNSQGKALEEASIPWGRVPLQALGDSILPRLNERNKGLALWMWSKSAKP